MRVLISISILAARLCLASNDVVATFEARDLRSEILYNKENNEYAVYHPRDRVWHQMHDETGDEAYWYRGDEYELVETVNHVSHERKPQKYIKSGPYWDRYTHDTVDSNEEMINVISYTFTEVDGKQERMRLSLPSHKVRSSEAMARLRRKSYSSNRFSEKDQALIQFGVDKCNSGTPTHFQNVECCMDDNGTLTWVPGIWLFFDTGKSETRSRARIPDICVHHAPENKYALIRPPYMSGLRIPVRIEDDDDLTARGSIPDETVHVPTEDPMFKGRVRGNAIAPVEPLINVPTNIPRGRSITGVQRMINMIPKPTAIQMPKTEIERKNANKPQQQSSQTRAQEMTNSLRRSRNTCNSSCPTVSEDTVPCSGSTPDSNVLTGPALSTNPSTQTLVRQGGLGRETRRNRMNLPIPIVITNFDTTNEDGQIDFDMPSDSSRTKTPPGQSPKA